MDDTSSLSPNSKHPSRPKHDNDKNENKTDNMTWLKSNVHYETVVAGGRMTACHFCLELPPGEG